MGKVTWKRFRIIMKLEVALYASKIRVTSFHLHLDMKNLTTKIIQLIAFLQGKQFVSPKRTDSRQNTTSIFVTSPIQFVRALQSVKILSQFQKRCSVVSGLQSQKKTHIAIFNTPPNGSRTHVLPDTGWTF